MEILSRTVLAAVVTAIGCSGGAGDPAIEDAEKRPNVIVVLVDELRSDRLGAYGFDERPTSPNLDAFAARSVIFERAISQDGWTVPSVASLFTGVYPQTHGVLRFIDPKVHLEGHSEGAGPVMMDAMSMDHQTLAEQFSAAGYSTAAILKSDVINAGRGFEQGFEYLQFLAKKPKDRLDSGAQLTDAALQWLESRRDDSRPFFLYLHYMDPHTSYIAPEPFYSKYSTEFESSLDGNHGPIVAFNEEGSSEPTAEDIRKLLALYDGEIEYWDTQFGRLMEYFETSGLLDETIVVVTADHGEAFWEHELFEHRGVFQENISVPMIFKVPGVEPRRIDSRVQMIDIGPTVVDLVGAERGPNWVGLSHAAAIRSNGPVQEQAVSREWAGERTLITPEGLKILLGRGEPRLYDLDVDPGETQNLATRRPEDFARLKTILEERFRRALELRDLFAPASPAELIPEQIEALKALGYLGD
jgi:arylsulfatase A-like enzyme